LLPPNTSDPSTTSLVPPSSDGQTPEKSELCEDQRLDVDSTTKEISPEPLESTPMLTTKTIRKPRKSKKLPSSTPESAVPTKKRTSKGKAKPSETPAETPPVPPTLEATTPASSPTLPAASTGRGRDCQPFWLPHTTELSKKLWLPTGTDLRRSALSSLSGFSRSLASSSWFSTRLQLPTKPLNFETIYSPSQLFLLPDITDLELGKIEEPEKPKKKGIYSTKTKKTVIREKFASNHSTKIRLRLDEKQKKVLNEWYSASRYIYNKCVERNTPFADKDTYNDLVLKTNYPKGHWMLEIPSDVRENAVRDYMKAAKSTEANRKVGNITHWKLGFRTKRDPQESLEVRSREYKLELKEEIGPCLYKGFSFKPTFFTKAKASKILRTREEMPETIEYDSRLVKTRLGEYYICIPDRKSAIRTTGGESQTPKERVCALDPGCRTFQTIYDPSGLILEVGADDMYRRIFPLCRDADAIASKLTKTHGKRRYRLRRAQLRIFRRVRRMVNDTHKKLAKFLVLNYNLIYLPSFNTSQMVYRKRRRINSKTAKAMLTWSHYGFKQHLLYKASCVTTHPCKVVVCSEAYTSKTCGRCGCLHTTLGGNKHYHCQSEKCRLSIDRDVNGARNILLRNIGSTALPASAQGRGKD
jgi:putative transposase